MLNFKRHLALFALAPALAAVANWNDHVMEFALQANAPPPNEAGAVAEAQTTMHDILNAVRRH